MKQQYGGYLQKINSIYTIPIMIHTRGIYRF